jgi:gas vesicle protein
MSQTNDEKCSIVNFLAGLGVGALIGAAAALMMAPKTGSETRDDLKAMSDDFTAKACKVTKELTDSSQDLLKKGKELIEATTVKVHEAVDAGKQAIEKKKAETETEASNEEEPTTDVS